MISEWSARALRERLLTGWSTLDDEQNERPVPVRRNVVGRVLLAIADALENT